MSVANNMAALALAQDNRMDLANAIHARHPLRGLKNEILKRGEFDTLTVILLRRMRPLFSCCFG